MDQLIKGCTNGYTVIRKIEPIEFADSLGRDQDLDRVPGIHLLQRAPPADGRDSPDCGAVIRRLSTGRTNQ